MLAHLGRLPAERIHNTLKLFAGMGEHPYTRPPAYTLRFLGELCRSGALEASDGLFGLARR